VQQVNDSEIQLALLYSFGPSKCYTHDTLSDILWVPASKQLTDKDSETATIGTNVIAYNVS
jgi:hypothetical protein